jgi:hypothetical protein
MNGSDGRALRGVAAAVTVLSSVMSHLAIVLGQGYGVALILAALQAGATGLLLWGWLPAHRWTAGLVTLALWTALAAGARYGAPEALLAEAGVAHGLLYASLLAVFARSLRPGRVALVTWVASRVNPRFHAGQIPYTIAVTWGWVGIFAAELGISAALLAAAPAHWAGFVTAWHLALPAGFALAEAAFRRWRWRHEHSTGLLETIRGTRRLMRYEAKSLKARQ